MVALQHGPRSAATSRWWTRFYTSPEFLEAAKHCVRRRLAFALPASVEARRQGPTMVCGAALREAVDVGGAAPGPSRRRCRPRLARPRPRRTTSERPRGHIFSSRRRARSCSRPHLDRWDAPDGFRPRADEAGRPNCAHPSGLAKWDTLGRTASNAPGRRTPGFAAVARGRRLAGNSSRRTTRRSTSVLVKNSRRRTGPTDPGSRRCGLRGVSSGGRRRRRRRQGGSECPGTPGSVCPKSGCRSRTRGLEKLAPRGEALPPLLAQGARGWGERTTAAPRRRLYRAPSASSASKPKKEPPRVEKLLLKAVSSVGATGRPRPTPRFREFAPWASEGPR